jgi:hypothetical protein
MTLSPATGSSVGVCSDFVMIQRVQLSLLSNSTVIHNSQHVLLRLLCIFGTVVLWYCAGAGHPAAFCIQQWFCAA